MGAVGLSLILLSVPIIQPILVFVTYIHITDQPLDAATAFTTVALFNIMRFPFAFLPMGMLQYIQSMISLRRLERYLALPELHDYVTEPTDDHTEISKDSGSIAIINGSFSWIDPDGPEILPIQDEPKKKQRRPHRGSRNSRKNARASSD